MFREWERNVKKINDLKDTVWETLAMFNGTWEKHFYFIHFQMMEFNELKDVHSSFYF